MVRLQLVLLRWKIEVWGRVEALWASHIFGMWLCFIGIVTSGVLLWWVPSPGIGVAIMGIAAALMTARKDPTAWEKAAWTFMMFSLLLVEVLAIHKDRRESTEAQTKALIEERAHFSEIGEGIKSAIRESDNGFTATLKQQASNLNTTMEQFHVNVAEITGDDSYAIVYPEIGRKIAGTDNTFPLTVRLCEKCKYVIPHVFVFIQRDIHSGDQGELIHEGRIEPLAMSFYNHVIAPDHNVESFYRVNIVGQSKPTQEFLKVRFNNVKGFWEFSWEIWRQEKYPHINPATGQPEGEVLKKIETHDWDTTIVWHPKPLTVKP